MQDHHERHGEDGAVIVEFAIVFVLFMVLLLWGLLTYGFVFGVQQSVTHAAAEAVRSVVNIGDYDGDGDVDEDDARLRIDEVVQEQLAWLDDGGVADDLTWTTTFPTCGNGSPQPVCAHVEVVYDWATYPLFPPLFDVAQPDVITSTASVQYQ